MARVSAPADFFFTVAALCICLALGLALCLWQAGAPLHDDTLRDVGQNVERLFGETV